VFFRILAQTGVRQFRELFVKFPGE